MAELYGLSEVVVSVPSSDGGTPVSVLESMACAKPVVCTDLPPLYEFITHGENGLLVPVRQVAPLAKAIIQLLEQPQQAYEYGQKAHLVVAEKANSELEMQRMEAIYYQLAALHKR
jgi:glycosyltransferase involved in cell wall biosynthesis